MKISAIGKQIIDRHNIVVGLVILAVVALMGLHTTGASAITRVITVHADGYEKTVKTDVSTVAEALQRAGVNVGEHDLVEPSLDTEIIDKVFNINVYRARPVTVVDGDVTRHVMTAYTSERLIAADAGVVVYPEDRYEMEIIDNILEVGMVGQRLKIIRATPMNLELYGNTLLHRTHSNSVSEILSERGIELKEGDRVEPSLDSIVSSEQTIRVIHTGTKTISETEPIPFETEYIYDSNRPAGARETKTEGVEGERLVTYEVVIENDKEVKRTELQSVVKTQPEKAVVIVGTNAPDPESNIALGQSMAASRGWADAEWICLLNLWTKESRWNHMAENPYSGAYGIPQALPGSKMASHGSDWQTNPATQIAWGLDYVSGRYGTPCGAWQFFITNNWY